MTSTTNNSSGGPLETYYAYDGSENSQIPTTVTHLRILSNVKEIPDNAFEDRLNLVTVEIMPGSQLGVIGEDAFSECKAMKYCNIPKYVRYVGKCAFFRCKSLLEIRLPEGLKVINKVVFCGCYDLRHVYIPSTIEEIRDEAFLNCDSLVYVNLPTGLKVIQEGAFHWCTSLRRIRIPSSVTKIGLNSFARCEGLISVELPIGLKILGTSAFMKCTSLVNVAIPSSVEELGHDVFLDCDELQKQFTNNDNVIQQVRKRFENLSLHEFCYFGTNMSSVTNTIVTKIDQLVPDAAYLNKKDAFGMTPFHLLALSAKPNQFLFQELQQQLSNPDTVNLVSNRDKWGNTPLDYLCQNETPDYVGVVQSLIQTILVKRCLTWLEYKNWRSEILDLIDRLFATWRNDDGANDMTTTRLERFWKITNRLRVLELKEALSILELALWKLKIGEAKFRHNMGSPAGLEQTRKRAKLSESTYMNILDDTARQGCRVNCCADVIILNVLPFLTTTT